MYDAFQDEFTRKYQEFATAEFNEEERHIGNVLEVILRMRQVANCTNLVGERGKASLALQAALAQAQKLHVLAEAAGVAGGGLDMKDPKVRELLEVLWENSGDECAICLDDLENPVITPCFHYFCQECIGPVAARGGAQCPLCRHAITAANVIPLPPYPSFFNMP